MDISNFPYCKNNSWPLPPKCPLLISSNGPSPTGFPKDDQAVSSAPPLLLLTPFSKSCWLCLRPKPRPGCGVAQGKRASAYYMGSLVFKAQQLHPPHRPKLKDILFLSTWLRCSNIEHILLLENHCPQFQYQDSLWVRLLSRLFPCSLRILNVTCFPGLTEYNISVHTSPSPEQSNLTMDLSYPDLKFTYSVSPFLSLPNAQSQQAKNQSHSFLLPLIPSKHASVLCMHLY